MISAVILTKNEEKNIVDCIESVSFCDEVIVVDDNSDDRTTDLAKRAKATVFTQTLNGDFSKQRNFGLDKAQGDWVLFVDADERVPSKLANEINSQILHDSSAIVGYTVRRIDNMWGKQLRYGETGNIQLVRLARRSAGTWEGKVHEKWKVKGTVGQLSSPLMHYPHQNVAVFLEEVNFYTDLRAKELYEKRENVHWWSIIMYPKAKFFFNYFVKQGYRDGIPGLITAIMMSFHSFLVRGKLWSLWKKR